MAKHLSLLLLCLLLFAKRIDACSPLPTPSVISINQVGTNIVFNLQSQSIYNCSYSVEVELACMGGTMSGVAPFYYTSPAFQASVNPYSIPQFTMNLAGLCQGGIYQYRFRQSQGGIFSPWSTVFTFTMPGVPIPTTMTVTASPTLICFPQTSQLTASVSGGCGGGGGATYSWSPVTGLSCTNCSNPVANPTTTTTYSVSAFGQGQANCWFVSGTITVVSPPSGLAMSVTNQTICIGANATVQASGSPTYTWNTGSNSSSIVVAPVVNTTYTVSGGASPCIGSATVSVIPQAQPLTPTVTPNNFLACSLSGSVMTAVSNVPNFAWWSGGTIFATPQNTMAVPNGTGAYSWFVSALSSTMLPQVAYNFAVCSASADIGPTQAQQTSAYASSNLSVGVTCTSGIQYWTVPLTASYSLVAIGASGANASSFGGRGRMVSGVVNLTAGTVIKIIVGQRGTGTGTTTPSSGGGGSYITSIANVPYLVAGGGGGLLGAATAALPNTDANILQPGFNAVDGTGLGGAATQGGTGSTGGYGSGGGGLSTNGTAGSFCGIGGGFAFVNGGQGGATCFSALGGFGGGGGTHASGGTGGGGGGGYSGGGGSSGTPNPNNGGGGGGSFFAAGLTSTLDLGLSIGNGTVQIIRLPVGGACSSPLVPVNFTISPTPTLVVSNQTVCAGVSTTLAASGGLTYTWSTGANTSSIVVVPTTNTLYTLASGTAPCNGQVTVNITVATPTAPTVTPNNQAFCINTYPSFTAVSNSTAYAWHNTIGGPTIATTNTLVMPGTPGTYSYYVSASQTLSSSGSLTFNATGAATTFVVPSGVTQLSINAWGARGGTGLLTGGNGGYAGGVLTVSGGQLVTIMVGGQGSLTTGGFNGGGNGGAGSSSTGFGGGGASDVRLVGAGLANRVLCAAGGGGVGGNATTYNAGAGVGGAGAVCGAPNGVGGSNGTGCSAGTAGGCAGGTAPNYGTGGAGGGLSSGGGLAGAPSGGFGQAGSLGQGGNGGDNAGTYGGGGGGVNGGGGGGGGYYGGSGAMSGNGGCNGGGGGGSSYADNTQMSSITFSGGVSTGNGTVTIAWQGAGVCTSSLTAVTVTVQNCFLPIELVQFDAVKESAAVKLKWTTKSEKNTDKFIIQRSHDMNTWTEICSVKASGNSSVDKFYDCTDDAPLIGTSYYRLKIIDTDRSFTYSDVKTMDFAHGKGHVVIHPNPAHDKLTINYVGDGSATGFVITDVHGRIQMKDPQLKVDGDKNTATIDISRLLPGVYFIVVTDNGIKETKKFVVE
jgi:hypothetical protein